jgi:hypothetical protein
MVLDTRDPPDTSGALGLTSFGGQIRTITHPQRIREILTGAARGRSAELTFEGDGRMFRVLLAPWAGEPGRVARESTAVEARCAEDGFGDVPTWRGQQVSVWFTHPGGIYGFRARVTTCARDRVFLDPPAAIARYTRRRTPRYAVVADGPTVTLALASGGRLHCDRVLDISNGGLLMVLPADVRFPVGAVTRVALELRTDRPIELVAACRHVREHGPGQQRVGLQLLDPPRTACLAIERYVQKMGLRPLEEGPAPQALPAVVRPGVAARR